MVQAQTQTQKGDIVFLGALPLNALPRRTLNISVMPVVLKDLVEWVSRRLNEGYRITHYIRHAGTIAALKALGIPLDDKPNADLYRYRDGDILVIVSLRNPPRGQDVAQVSPEDLEAWIAYLS
jgi:hypothetical protein